MKKTIALLYGGAGAEHDVSVLGFNNSLGIFNREKYDVVPIFIDKDASWYIIEGDLRIPTFTVRVKGKAGFWKNGKIIHVDCVFPLLHGDLGEDGVIQGYLAAMGIPFVGEGVSVGSLCIDKAYCKAVAESLGVPVARYKVFRRGVTSSDALETVKSELGLPVFVKPTGLGSSVGASMADTAEKFINAFLSASLLGDGGVICEELITEKRELECALLVTDTGTVVTYPSEIIIDGTYGYNEKYKQKTRTCVIADVDKTVKERVVEYSYRLASGIGIGAMARIDFFLSKERVIFNEINTMPGFTEDSMYLKMLESFGIPPEKAVEILVDRAIGKK